LQDGTIHTIFTSHQFVSSWDENQEEMAFANARAFLTMK